MTIFRSNSHLFGYTTPGRKHLDSGEKNQDSCLVKEFKGGVVLAVADGVGSCKYPRKASTKAVRCLYKTAKKYQKTAEIDDEFVRSFSKRFQKGFLRKRKQMSTTLLFVVVYDDGRIVLGQAGDGALISGFNDNWAIFKKKNDDFTNETYALNAARTYKGWAFKAKNLDQTGVLSFCACTDGLSEDITDLISFAKTVVTKVQENKKQELTELVDKWPVPGSSDDKSLAVISIEFQERGPSCERQNSDPRL